MSEENEETEGEVQPVEGIDSDFSDFLIDEQGLGSVPDDWVPFEERPEFRNAMALANAMPEVQELMNQGQDSRDLGRTRTGRVVGGAGNARRVDEAAAAPQTAVDRTNELRLAMVQFIAGGQTDAAINAIYNTYGEEVGQELFGDGATSKGYIESGYSFQSLDANTITSQGFLDSSTRQALNVFDGKSHYEIQAAYHGMNDAEQDALKATLFQAGYYEGGTPQFDGMTAADLQAFQNFATDNLANPDQAMDVVLANRIEERYLRRRGETLGAGADGSSAGSGGSPGRVIRLSDPEVIKDTLREFALGEFGMAMPEEQIEMYAARASAGERSAAEAYYSAVDAQQAAADEAVLAAELGEIDMFVDAVAGPMDQALIAPAQWATWSRRAGLDPHAEMTDENVRNVARWIASDYYDQTGNWADTAALWYSGPGRSGVTVGAQHPLEGRTSVRDFQNRTLDNMVTLQNERMAIAGQGGGGGNTFVYDFDPNAAAARELRAANLASAQTWEYAERGQEFFNLLARGASI